jgi:hypothetical protein
LRGMRRAVPALTVMFWVAAAILVVLFMLSSFVGEVGSWSRLLTGVALLVVVACSGAIAWVEFGSNPPADAERGEWTNKMLFYGLVFAISFFVGFLYWVGIYFAR